MIDFEGSRFISSEGLEALLAVRRRCEERRGQVRLAGLDDNCRKILQITRLDHRFECHPDVTTALKCTPSGPSTTASAIVTGRRYSKLFMRHSSGCVR